jgi:hypothetical protein
MAGTFTSIYRCEEALRLPGIVVKWTADEVPYTFYLIYVWLHLPAFPLNNNRLGPNTPLTLCHDQTYP